jgi:hypothetical protein
VTRGVQQRQAVQAALYPGVVFDDALVLPDEKLNEKFHARNVKKCEPRDRERAAMRKDGPRYQRFLAEIQDFAILPKGRMMHVRGTTDFDAYAGAGATGSAAKGSAAGAVAPSASRATKPRLPAGAPSGKNSNVTFAATINPKTGKPYYSVLSNILADGAPGIFTHPCKFGEVRSCNAGAVKVM